jgi:hypothetical protein
MVRIRDGERPVRPLEAREMGLVDSVWAMTVNCWEQNPTQRPTMAAVVRFLREWSVILPVDSTCRHVSHSYTLRAANLPLPTLAPWRPMGNVDDGANHTLISPVHAGGQQTPTQSPLYRDGHRALSNLGDSNSDRPFSIIHNITCSPLRR